MDVPSEMDALVADAAVPGGAAAAARLRVARVPVPRPRRGQVLVKIGAAPCNPADLYYIEGRYGIDRPLPATPGFEGAGVVVAAGGGLLGRWLLGKRVACGGHESTGTWAQYCLTHSDQCMPLHRGLDVERGATALANPMTALALLAVMRAGRHRAYVHTAAASQLGRIMLAESVRRGVVGIHVVRRAAHADELRALGAAHVLVSTEPGFEAALAARCHELGATIAFDAVAGASTGQLANALPRGGEVVIYGALAGEPCHGIDPMELAFGHKRISGFEIAAYLKQIGLWRTIRLGRAAQARVAAGQVATAVRAKVKLAEAPTALAAYANAMSDGKVLLMP